MVQSSVSHGRSEVGFYSAYSAENVLSLEAFVAGITNNIFTRVTISENISLADNDNVLRKSTMTDRDTVNFVSLSFSF